MNTHTTKRWVVAAGAAVAVLATVALAPWATAAPNDPKYGQQWGPQDLDVERAWTKATGDGVIVAIADTGVDLEHPDLAAKLIGGRDFVDGDTNPDDPEGHGTHVAGIAAALTGNGVGIAGVAPAARIMPVRVLSTTEAGSITSVSDGIRWAADNGAEVINVSLSAGIFLGVVAFDQVADGCEYAFSRGALCVVTAGNDSEAGNDTPSGYDHGINALVVTAHDRSGRHADFASRPDTKWGVSAPGVDILSSWPGGGYKRHQGTSMAAPHVAGLAALLFQSGMTNRQVAERIVSTAIPTTNAQLSGAGRVNAARAVGLQASDRGTTATSAPDLSGNTVEGGDFTATTVGSSGGFVPGSGDTTDTTDPLAGTGRGEGDFGSDLGESEIEGDVSIAARKLDLGDYRKQTYGFLAASMIAAVGGWAIWQQREFARRNREVGAV